MKRAAAEVGFYDHPGLLPKVRRLLYDGPLTGPVPAQSHCCQQEHRVGAGR